jgi:hypothetical protein
MKSVAELKEERQNKNSELFNKVGLFWAFSNEQFNTSKTPLKEGEKYVSIGAGGYLPKSQVDNFLKGMETISKWEKSEIKKQKDGKESHILYELQNYECFYTNHIDDLDFLPYTKKEIWQVYNKYKEQMQEAF